MSTIPREQIESILRATDIVEVVNEHVPLKKAGSNFKGLCPFHGEKSPSFVITPSRQIFYCFGCHEGGDALNFLIKIESLTFMEALKKLADRAGIALKTEDEKSKNTDPHQIYHRINAYALWFFCHQAQTGSEFKNYLQNRAITSETAKTFELGLAPEGFGHLKDFFETKKIPLEKAIDLGLIKRAEGGRVYDFFRHRLIFPIRSHRAEIIGFGGRTLSQATTEAKYINSRESPVYHKSHELYGLHVSKKAILKLRQVVVVEGYMDVLACHQMGIEHVVAPLGTSLTSEHLHLLKRFADEVILMFDGDAAGQKAALKSVRLCLEQGVHPRVVVLENGMDPADFLKMDQALILRDLVNKAPLAMDWLLSLAVSTASSRPGEQAKIVARLLEWVELLPSAIERQLYEGQMGRYFGFSGKKSNKVVENKKDFDKSHPLVTGQLGLEEMVVFALLNKSNPPCDTGEMNLSELLSDQQLKGLASFAEKFYKNYETSGKALSIRQLPEEYMALAARLLASSSQLENIDVRGLVDKLKRRHVKAELKHVTAEILAAETRRDDIVLKELLEKKRVLLKKTGATKLQKDV